MLRFTDTEQAYPDVRSPDERATDFNEIYSEYAAAKAAEQAARCSQCGIPFCQVHCPLGNHIPDWLRLVAEGQLEEAYQVSAETNTFPEICGRICPQDRLCEGNCVVNKGFKSITIGSIEKYITEQAWQNGWMKEFKPSRERAESIGIIGSGPAGLAAAEKLRREGYKVDVYDRHDRAGGLLIYGIPNFKLDKQVVERRIAQYEQSGITFHLNTEIGKDISLDALRAKHAAVLIATGVYQARDLRVPGRNLDGVVPALDYLIASNKRGLGDAIDGFDAKGKQVLVIGGGDTAMDCVRTAVRQDAKSVHCLYRRDRENMPGSAREVKHAEEEGVVFDWLTAPRAFDGDGSLTRMLGHKMQLGFPDAQGRRSPQEVPDSDFEKAADMVILALGFEPENLSEMWNASELMTARGGRVKIDADFKTTMDGVFAAGDIVRGASLVVWAIKDGRDAAAQIHRYCMAKKDKKAA
ncbi:MAG: NAD(P)-dependent oxidoreductase [Rickettsiales bacterium]|nr:NAD(P)-dependent oxidoreductase [Rickettsiales bacterium]